MRKIFEAVTFLIIGVGIFALIYYSGILLTTKGLNTLAEAYLNFIPNVSNQYTSWSYEVVTSVIWDHRGFDTYFETSVLFLAIVAAVGLLEGVRKYLDIEGTTIITKLVSKLLAPVIVVISVSIALHGHISPGGGFQGGALFVIAPLLLMLAFNASKISEKGFEQNKLILMRALAVTFIAVVGLTPLIYSLVSGANAYLFQNIRKPDSTFSYSPILEVGNIRVLLSGNLIIFNLLEYVAVLTGFTVALFLLTIEFEGGGEND
ncbi:MAG: MnhB domain-containing protein [Desulfurococcaceae archaeon TW002]